MEKAIIINYKKNLYKIIDLKTNEIISDVLARGKFRKITLNEKSSFNKQTTFKSKLSKVDKTISPKVGDMVLYEKKEDNFIILDILERKNDLTRPNIANIDYCYLVFSIVEPKFSFDLLERFIINLEKNNILYKIIITKIDLVDKTYLDNFKEKLSYYLNLGTDIFYVNNFSIKNKDKITINFKNKIIAFAGQTGVGKSSLLNALNDELNLKTQEISKALGRGKHTTRHIELYPFQEGLIADTPGFSKLDFNILYKEDLKKYYKDFLELSINCKFKSKCNHINEIGCNVIKQYKENKILKERYEAYIKFFDFIKNQKRKY